MRTAALLVTGAGGSVPTAVLEAARAAGRAVPMARATDRRELDLADPFGVRDAVRTWTRVVRADSPTHRAVVVNVDAWNDLEAAEVAEDDAYAVNAAGPAVLAAACVEVGAWLLHISTADVFGGPADRPWEVEDVPAPVSALGRTRLAGEQAVREIHPHGSWVLRTGWAYGPAPTDLVGAAAAAASGTGEVLAVADQRGSPTWAGDLGPAVVALALSDTAPGLLHAASAGDASWLELTREVLAVLGADPARARPAQGDRRRPEHAVLGTASWERAGLPALPDWRDGLRRALAG